MLTHIFNARFIRHAFYPLGLLALLLAFNVSAKEYTLLNVSYDVSRELYRDVNAAFADYWLKETGDKVTIQQSHDGSTKQAAAVIAGRYHIGALVFTHKCLRAVVRRETCEIQTFQLLKPGRSDVQRFESEQHAPSCLIRKVTPFGYAQDRNGAG